MHWLSDQQNGITKLSFTTSAQWPKSFKVWFYPTFKCYFNHLQILRNFSEVAENLRIKKHFWRHSDSLGTSLIVWFGFLFVFLSDRKPAWKYERHQDVNSRINARFLRTDEIQCHVNDKSLSNMFVFNLHISLPEMRVSVQYAFLSLGLSSWQKIWYCFVTDLVCTVR